MYLQGVDSIYDIVWIDGADGRITYGDVFKQNEVEMSEFNFDIANIDISRAVTHNKGIMNGIDAVLISTGNDFRAVEAGIHAYASSKGKYKSLSECTIIDNIFKIKLKIPLSIGTIGGITDIHPMVKLSLKLLDNPTSDNLMNIICSVGLAQNYAAVKSLVTSGIQKGHMKMHLINLLIKQNATKDQIDKSCLLYTSPSPRDKRQSRMPSSA